LAILDRFTVAINNGLVALDIGRKEQTIEPDVYSQSLQRLAATSRDVFNQQRIDSPSSAARRVEETGSPAPTAKPTSALAALKVHAASG